MGRAASYDRPRFAELFDVLVISGEEDMRKPDPAIYELAPERMGLPAEELVFVDDLPSTSSRAREMGIHTCTTRAPQETIPSSKSCFGVRVSG